jgi:hypothetical protein
MEPVAHATGNNRAPKSSLSFLSHVSEVVAVVTMHANLILATSQASIVVVDRVQSGLSYEPIPAG